MRLSFILIAYLLFTHLKPNAQSLFSNKNSFSRFDTLAGSITPERKWWDVVMYDLDIEPDMNKFSIAGSNRILFSVSGNPVPSMQIDLQEPMQIDSAKLNGKHVTYTRENNLYFIKISEDQINELAAAYKTGSKKLQELLIYYSGIPKPALYPPWDGGLVWQKDAKNNSWVGVACQGQGASCWWPCKDHPYDEPDSTLIAVTTPKDLMNVSNGRLRNSYETPDGKKKWQWFVSYPINTYNITMNIGKYVQIKDTLLGENGTLSLDYYVLNYNEEKAKKHFKQVKPAMRALEHWMGPYPFYNDGYKLVETSYLGMEHQSAVAYGNKYINGYMGSDLSGSGWGLNWDYIIVHESGHEWFGNNVSCNDVADLWIHEGFTNYSEAMYVDYHYGKAAANAYVQGIRKNIQNDKPIKGSYDVKNEGSSDMYYKSASLIHMIRAMMQNDSLFRELIRGIQIEFKLKQISSIQLEQYISVKTGLQLEKTFEQYLSTTQIPTLEYYLKKEKSRNLLYYRWSNCINGFDMPILLPGNNSKLTLKTPGTKWQFIETGCKTEDEIKSVLDKNFYVNYKPSSSSK
jgi:aminopeptidase N